jgi:peroxiredoxin family protein
MNKHLLFLFLIASNYSLMAQIDFKKDSNYSKINAIPSNNKNLKKTDFIDVKADEIQFENSLKKAVYKKKKEDELKVLKEKGILTRQEIYERSVAKELSGLNRQYAKIDKNLGGLNINTESITVLCKDFGNADDDDISIFLNGSPAIRNITLTSGFQEFWIPIKVGLNTIEFIALDEGIYAPNTAALIIFDDKGNELMNQFWYLATGAKATLSIVRDK